MAVKSSLKIVQLPDITYPLQVVVIKQLAVVAQDRQNVLNLLLVLRLLCFRLLRATETQAPLRVLHCDDLE